jgi:hypothetical protein
MGVRVRTASCGMSFVRVAFVVFVASQIVLFLLFVRWWPAPSTLSALSPQAVADSWEGLLRGRPVVTSSSWQAPHVAASLVRCVGSESFVYIGDNSDGADGADVGGGGGGGGGGGDGRVGHEDATKLEREHNHASSCEIGYPDEVNNRLWGSRWTTKTRTLFLGVWWSHWGTHWSDVGPRLAACGLTVKLRPNVATGMPMWATVAVTSEADGAAERGTPHEAPQLVVVFLFRRPEYVWARVPPDAIVALCRRGAVLPSVSDDERSTSPADGRYPRVVPSVDGLVLFSSSIADTSCR